MITVLRRKVFWSIFLSAAGVLLVILLAINVLDLRQTASKKESILNSALTILQPETGASRGHGNMRGGGKNKSELLRSVSEDELGILRLDEDGSVLSLSGCAGQLDEETVSAIAAAAFSDTDGRGNADGYEYKVLRNNNSIGVAFLNAASLRRENMETALLSLLALAAACCLFALMARILSRVIVRPVEENMQAQKRFIADASHELKTPLTVIDANASVLEQSIGRNKWLDYIKEQSGRMSGLVNELLQLSNLEEARDAGTAQTQEHYDAAETVMTAVLPFESMAFERGLTLEMNIPETLPAAGCKKDLEQLAAILTDNAVKHSCEGGTVTIAMDHSTARHGWKEKPMLELRVSNSGEDIPPEALPHIFDRFYRVDSSRTHKDNSYGLGLAIARSLAEKNDGSITAASQNGITEFVLRLPIES